VKEKTMTHSTLPSPATINGKVQRQDFQKRLTTLGIVARQLAKDDLLGQGVLFNQILGSPGILG
jgi:phosphohistidine phosphatase SixA